MSETAYQYGTIDEVVIEKLIDDTWTVVEAPVEEKVETLEEVIETLFIYLSDNTKIVYNYISCIQQI